MGLAVPDSCARGGGCQLVSFDRSHKQDPPTIIDFPSDSYIGIFVGLVTGTIIIYCTDQLIWLRGKIRASRKIHAELTTSILHTTLHFLDRTPTGRIIQRFTQDTRSIDGRLANNINNVLQLTASIIGKMVGIVIFTPAFLAPGVLLGAIGGIIAQVYIKAQLPIKRYVSGFP